MLNFFEPFLKRPHMKSNAQQIVEQDRDPLQSEERLHQFGSNTVRQNQLPSAQPGKQSPDRLPEGEFNHWEGTFQQEQDHSNHGEVQQRSGSLSKSQKKKKNGGVRLILKGAPVSAPQVSSLSEIHDWLMDNQAALRAWEGKIVVEFSGVVSQREQVIWAYYHPKQKLILKGKSNAVVSGFDRHPNGKKKLRTATPGYFLAYRPIIDQQMAVMDADNKPIQNTIQPANANFLMKNLTIEGFVSGGVEMNARQGTLPNSADAYKNSFGEETKHGDGGLSAFMKKATFKNNHFRQMGTKYYKKGNERYNTDKANDPEAYMHAGYGGIMARGLSGSKMINNQFTELINRKSNKTNETPVKDKETGTVGPANTKVEWERLVHGIYLRDNSSNNNIRTNDFENISGAPVKFTNMAHNNKVRKNASDNTGVNAFVLEHFNPKSDRKEQNSNGYRGQGNNVRIDKARDNKKLIQGNTIGTRFNSDKRMDLFKEKEVGKGKKSKKKNKSS